MLEQRVARLEQILERLEPKITEILLAGAKQSDVQKIQVETAEIKGKVSMLPTWWMLWWRSSRHGARAQELALRS
jgi:hypothetical protein